MKKYIYHAVCALFIWTLCPVIAGAVNFGIFQGHIVDGALQEEEPEIFQGHILDGVIAEDDGNSTASVMAEPASFTVMFQPGKDAVVDMTSKSVTNGRAYGELPLPRRNGYVFQGWHNLSGALVSANTVVNLNADQVLFAQWGLATYRVTLNPNGGVLYETLVEVTDGNAYGALPRPVRSGYTFDGWYTLSRGGLLITPDTSVTRKEDHELYAHWTSLVAPTDLENYGIETECAFLDVPGTSSYYPAVCWAVRRGITSGTSPETFSPNDPCKRRHILTFLWRANGSPEPLAVLSDVAALWGKSAAWATQKALILPGTYNGEEGSTRSDAVTYLWKLAGSPQDETSLRSALRRFSDVSPESDYAAAVAWALDTGITNGTTDTTFSPERICTRGQIVTFLYRYYTR